MREHPRGRVDAASRPVWPSSLARCRTAASSTADVQHGAHCHHERMVEVDVVAFVVRSGEVGDRILRPVHRARVASMGR